MAKKAGDVGSSAVSSPVSGPSVSKGFGARGGGYTSFGDMFDGGGPGRSGGPFQGGGLLSAFGNAITGNRGMGVGPEAGVGFAGYGYHDASGNWVPAGIDMQNGGGPGRAGNVFMGGGKYSGILNMLGVRPLGYNDMLASPEQAAALGSSGVRPTPAMAALAPTTSSTPQPRPGVPAVQPMNTAANDPFIGISQLFASRFNNNPQLGPTIENLLRNTMTEDQLVSALGPAASQFTGPSMVSGDTDYNRPAGSVARRNLR